MVDFSSAVAGYAKRFTASANSIKINLSFVKKISDRLAFAIRHSGHSKGDLAASIGVPGSSVSRWLAGSEPRSDRLTAIAKFLDVDVNWLITGYGQPAPPKNAESSGNLKDQGISESAHVVREDPPMYNARNTELPTDLRLARLESAIDRLTAGQARLAEALEALVKKTK